MFDGPLIIVPVGIINAGLLILYELSGDVIDTFPLFIIALPVIIILFMS